MKHNRKTFLDRKKQKELIQASHKERAYIGGNIPITGRSMSNYHENIFPDIDNLVKYMNTKNYLDIACGINHEYSESLLRRLSGKNKVHCLDIHDKTKQIEKVKYYKGSIYHTHLQNNMYDCITINNFVYFWEYKISNLINIFKELHRIIKKEGEIRIFPVYYGNYFLDNLELHEYLNKYFMVRCLFPKNDYSKESPIYIEKGDIKQTDKGNGINEYNLNHTLMSQVLILKKI